MNIGVNVRKSMSCQIYFCFVMKKIRVKLNCMKQSKNIRMTITCSIEAYRRIGELAQTQKQTQTIAQILESLIYFKGNFYELLAIIGSNKK